MIGWGSKGLSDIGGKCWSEIKVIWQTLRAATGSFPERGGSGCRE